MYIKKYLKIFSIAILMYYIVKDCSHNTKKNTKNTNKSKENIKLYNESIDAFIKVDARQISKNIKDNKEFFLYTGRVTCPWCIKFVPSLSKIAVEEKIEILYLDSENSKKDSELKRFRDSYGIKFVPSLIYFGKSKVVNPLELNITSNKFNKTFLIELMMPYIK